MTGPNDLDDDDAVKCEGCGAPVAPVNCGTKSRPFYDTPECCKTCSPESYTKPTRRTRRRNFR